MSSDLVQLGNRAESTLHSQCCVILNQWGISLVTKAMLKKESVEQARYRLLGGGAADRLADQRRDRKNADIACGEQFLGRLDRVCDDEFLQPRLGDTRDRAAGQHAVADIGVD